MAKPDTTLDNSADKAAAWKRRKYRVASEIEELAGAYCDGKQDPILYHQAIVIGQCDLMISRLRAQAVRILELFADRHPFLGSRRQKKFKQVNDISVGPEQNDLAAFKNALPHLDRLGRLEQRIWLRRTRALQVFLATKKKCRQQRSYCSSCCLSERS